MENINVEETQPKNSKDVDLDTDGIKEQDVIYFDKNNSHQIEINKNIYTVENMNNVVVVLWD